MGEPTTSTMRSNLEPLIPTCCLFFRCHRSGAPEVVLQRHIGASCTHRARGLLLHRFNSPSHRTLDPGPSTPGPEDSQAAKHRASAVSILVGMPQAGPVTVGSNVLGH